MTQPEQEPEVMFDNMSFRLCMDGIWASVKLHNQNPDRGMTKEQAEEHLKLWFPEASEIEIEGV